MNRTRPKQIVIRVSEEELSQIKEKVKQSGKNQQQYIIEALTQSNIVNTDGIKELIPELKRVGNNLNQIAHALNDSSYYSYNLITENQKDAVREEERLSNQVYKYDAKTKEISIASDASIHRDIKDAPKNTNNVEYVQQPRRHRGR